MNTVESKTLTPEQVAAEIAKREKKFKAASPAQKRVLVAKDVIKLIKLRKVQPSTGDFLSEWSPVGYEDLARNHPRDLRELILEGKLETCTVCALGGLMVGCTLYNDKVKYHEWGFTKIGDWIADDKPMPNGLNEIFSREQLILIEQAFERGDGYFKADKENLEGTAAAVRFGIRHGDPDSRLLAIMRNIVKNKGEFKP